MYLDFFQLQRDPFQVTPDPAFFYFFAGHREALAALIYGVEHRKGFIVLTGEVGVGKTTILRAFLERIDQEQTKVIYLFDANVSFNDLLKVLLQEFGAVPESENAFLRMNQFHLILTEQFRQGRNVVLIIDESQNMPAETLEGLRVLSNLETTTDKLLQIIFCGQPEFDEKLERTELRQLKQRIAVRATVTPLTEAEGISYIEHRLSIAGMPDRVIFTKSAIRQIIKEAHGIPRLINILCDNALITAFGYQERQVKGQVAREVIADRKVRTRPRAMRWWVPALGVAVAVSAAGMFLLREIDFGFLRGAQRSLSETQRPLQLPAIPEVAVKALEKPAAAVVQPVPIKPQQPMPDLASKSSITSEQAILDPTTKESLAPANQPTTALPVSDYMLKGDRLMELGDLASARLFYLAAAEAGSAIAMTAVGKTYDPQVINQRSLHGIYPDPAKAAQWYRQAVQAGDLTAAEYLRHLTALGEGISVLSR